MEGLHAGHHNEKGGDHHLVPEKGPETYAQNVADHRNVKYQAGDPDACYSADLDPGLSHPV